MRKQSVNKARLKLAKQKNKAKIKARRPAHKKFLLHPATVLVLLIIGVLLSAFTLRANADSANISVNGVIPATPLTEAAVILDPHSGQHFRTRPITLNGSCPYKSYVKLYRNDVFSGTALCNPGGSFSLQTDLSLGANTFLAHVFNVTDQEGPLSDAVTVFYDSPAPAPKAPLSLSSDYHYQGYSINQTASWTVKIIGGSAPFALNVKWGDGSESNYVSKDNAELGISHSYSKAGNFKLKVSATDAAGSNAFLELVALVVNQRPAAAVGTTGSGSIPPSTNFLWLAWPSYSVIILMLLCFWLGERQEYYYLMRHRRRHHLRYR